jgi:zinc transporter ZupT
VEARATPASARTPRFSAWLTGLVPLALIAAIAVAFVLLDAPGLPERTGPPVEEVAVERTVLRPGHIELTLRNDGPDAVRIAQAAVNDGYVQLQPAPLEIGRLEAKRLDLVYPWVEGEAYEVFLLTSTGGTIDHEVAVATETPRADAGFYGLMALLGVYVGIIPVSIGMLWLPFVRRVSRGAMQALLAFTLGLLGFLALDATFEGIELSQEGAQAFGGPLLVFLGAVVAYLALAGVESYIGGRRQGERAFPRDPSTRLRLAQDAGRCDRPSLTGHTPGALALLIAIGIGLHNLGEGLAIGSAYATGALALGAFLVVGFALHNTTEGLAIVAPLGARGDGSAAPGGRAALPRLLALGLIAGAPAILGAWIGASAFNASLAAFLLGVGAGAIVQVIAQIAPSIRDRAGRVLHPVSVGGLLTGFAVLYLTSLLVSV